MEGPLLVLSFLKRNIFYVNRAVFWADRIFCYFFGKSLIGIGFKMLWKGQEFLVFTKWTQDFIESFECRLIHLYWCRPHHALLTLSCIWVDTFPRFLPFFLPNWNINFQMPLKHFYLMAWKSTQLQYLYNFEFSFHSISSC